MTKLKYTAWIILIILFFAGSSLHAYDRRPSSQPHFSVSLTEDSFLHDYILVEDGVFVVPSATEMILTSR